MQVERRRSCHGYLEGLVESLVTVPESGATYDRLRGHVGGFGRTVWCQIVVSADLGKGVDEPAAHSLAAKLGIDDEARGAADQPLVRTSFR